MWSSWSGWSSCSKSCGTGQKKKSRWIKTNAKNGGEPCQGSGTQIDACIKRRCCFETDTLFCGHDLGGPTNDEFGRPINSPKFSQKRCQGDPTCNFWSYDPKPSGIYAIYSRYRFKRSDSGRQSKLGATSGPRFCSN